MDWRIKGIVQRTLTAVPGGVSVNDLLQRTVGGLRDYEANVAAKVNADWVVLAGHMRVLGIPLAGQRYVEIGTGWYPTLPVCFQLAGAKSVVTFDLHRHLSARLTQRMLRGHGGEFTRMQWAYEFTCNRRVLACRNQSELGDQLESQLTCGLTPADFHELFRADWAQALTAATARTLPAALKTVPPHLHPLDQVSCLYGAEYLRRQSVPSLAELRSRVEVRLPFLDPAYLDLALRLPPSLRLGTTVHRHILARTRPALLRITNANTGAPAGAGDVRQRLARKWRALAKRHFGYDRFRHYVDVPAWLRGPLYQPIASVLLEPRTLDRGCFEPDAIRRLLTEHQTGVAQHAEKLLLLFYFELWHRLFLDGEPWGHDVTPAPPPGPAADFVVSQAGEVRRLPNKQIIGKTHLFSVDGNRGQEKGKQ